VKYDTEGKDRMMLIYAFQANGLHEKDLLAQGRLCD
jgi:hypothetical protein